MANRGFFSRSREQRSMSSTSGRAFSRESSNPDSTSRPQLRRVQAFHSLHNPTDSTARTGSIPGKGKAWLEEAVATARCMSVMDNKEITAPNAHQSPDESTITVSEFSFDDKVFTSIPKRPKSVLRHQRKSTDLRSQYSGKSSSDAGEDSDIPTGSVGTTVDHPEVPCVCREAFEEAPESVVACDVCEESSHFRCVGPGHCNLAFFGENTSSCPDCEPLTFREIAA